MARLQDLLANLLCHEAISFLIYGTAFLLFLFYIPYWIRQQLDMHYLKFLAKKAREKYTKQRMECSDKSPDSPCLDSGLLKDENDDDDYGDDIDDSRERKLEEETVNVYQRDSDEKISFVSSRIPQ